MERTSSSHASSTKNEKIVCFEKKSFEILLIILEKYI